jgi:phosphotransferase system IIA component
VCSAILLGLALVGPARADDSAAMRQLIDKAIQAQGGEAQLAKFQTATSKLKGTLHAMGMALEFTGDVTTQGSDQQRIVIEFQINNQNFRVISVFNKDKGWVKVGDDLIEMDKDKVAESREEAYAGWVMSLIPLKDKAFTLAPAGEIKVADQPAVGVRISRKGNRDVTLYFDKKTNLLVKSENRVKDEASGQEVTQETYLSAYDEKGTKQAMKIVIKRDGKDFLDATMVEIKPEGKLDDSTFGKP